MKPQRLLILAYFFSCAAISRAEQDLGKLPGNLNGGTTPPVLNSQIADPSALLDPEDGPLVLAKPAEPQKKAEARATPVPLLPEVKADPKFATAPEMSLLPPLSKPATLTPPTPGEAPAAATPLAPASAVSLLPPIAMPAVKAPQPEPVEAALGLPVLNVPPPAESRPTPAPILAVEAIPAPPPAKATPGPLVEKTIRAPSTIVEKAPVRPSPPAQKMVEALAPQPSPAPPLARIDPKPKAAPPPLLPAEPPAEVAPPQVPVAREPIAPSFTTIADAPAGPEIAIILSNNRFYPSSIRLKSGQNTRLLFTTVNKRPAALIIERLQIQRWIAKDDQPSGRTELDRARWEMNRELSAQRITEILLNPVSGVYTFHDALTGARGEIQVE